MNVIERRLEYYKTLHESLKMMYDEFQDDYTKDLMDKALVIVKSLEEKLTRVSTQP
jgi:hypothetical protein